MVKISGFINGILSFLFIPFVLTVSFAEPLFLRSSLFLILLSLYGLFNVFLLFLPGKAFRKLFRGLLLAAMMLVVILMLRDKPEMMVLGKGGSYDRVVQNDTLRLSLLDLKIKQERGNLRYDLTLKVNTDTLRSLERRRAKIASLRILKIAHTQIRPYRISGEESVILYEGQNASFYGTAFTLEKVDPEMNIASLRYHDILFNVPLGDTVQFFNRPLLIEAEQSTLGSELIFLRQKRGRGLLFAAFPVLLLLNGIFSLPGKDKDRLLKRTA
ncbi:MAG: hypothetical protein WC372_03785 [Candidatus Neomarinimicrobiota bacterium]|jgi:hypothetical protein|nr:hypothetical protein [Candidatus Neomarinimicrobiota bacterium]MDD3966031.1 hypothetical protein [Candidatus Neomarinimicrobiota bacterium]